MNHKRLTGVLMVMLALLLSVGGTVAQNPEPRAEVSIEATVNSRVSYQGVLKEDGSPVTGSRDMTFRLYSDSACTTQVGGDIAKPGVSVADGLFTVALDVPHDDLNGQGLWLEVEVGGTAIVCQEIMPVPYALSLRPGATVAGEGPGWGSPILLVENSSNADDSRAIRGYASATTGSTTGVNGRTDSSTDGAIGVYGYAGASNGTTFGVYGQSLSSSGRGVYGHATATSGTAYGVWGQSESNADWASGVVGKATAASGFTHGVQGTSASPNGHGVYGWATAASGPTWGVYGQSDSPDGYGVFGWNTAGGYAGFFKDDVAQTREGNGLVKAGVYAVCGTSPSIDRSFNNVGGTITVSSGGGTGSCIIDFGFQVDDRFWTATAGSAAPRFVSCVPGASANRITCYRFDHLGAVENGYIMVMVY